MRVKITENYIFVEIPFSQKDKAKELYGTWVKEYKLWKFPISFWTLKNLLKNFPQLHFEPDFMRLGSLLQQKRINLLNIAKKIDTEGRPELRQYQRVDVEYLANIEHVGIFNQPRTGKTPTSIVLVTDKYKAISVLTICSKSLLYNWEREVEKWGDHKVFVLNGTKKQREQKITEYLDTLSQGLKAWLITTYRTATLEVETLANFNFHALVVDEGHRLRHRLSQQSKAIKQIGKNVSHRIVLTGTPTVKSKMDIFGLLEFLYPNKFSNYWDFYRRYFVETSTTLVNNNQIYDRSNIFNTNYAIDELTYNEQTIEELNEYLAFYSIRRLRKDIMQWLPAVQETFLELEMDSQQRKLYKEMEKSFVIKLENGEELDAPNLLSQLMRLRQITVDPNILGINATSVKTQAILELLEDRDNPTIVFSMFTSYLKRLEGILATAGYRVARLDGEIIGKIRQAIVDDFQNGKIDVLLANPLVAGEGLTLNRADMAIFADTPWNPAEVEQAKDRILPTTETDNKETLSVIYLKVKNTVDEWMLDLLKDKKKITELINEGGRLQLLKLMKK